MIGKKITSLRKEKKLSIEELSQELNIASDVINKWEKGDLNPEISDLIKLSEFFDISTDFLLEQTNKRNFTYYERETKPEKKLELVSCHRNYFSYSFRFNYYHIHNC